MRLAQANSILFGNCHRALASPQRLPGLDYLRGLAILSVVFFHFHFLPYGYLGVDLFFVISGFLVGGPFLGQMTSRNRLNAGGFYFARCAKIWPSYFSFLAIGGGVSARLYQFSHPEAVLRLSNLPKYLFFYLNYKQQDSLIFAQIWSLCVEEHFYLLLPPAVLFLKILKFRSNKTVVGFLIAVIIGINLGRFYLAATGHETEVVSHSRFDAMIWGMLAWFTLRDRVVPVTHKLTLGLAAIGLLALLIGLDLGLKNKFFTAAVFHGGISVVGYLIVVSIAHARMSYFGWLRFISYFSYNYYLWHMLLYFLIADRFGKTFLGLTLFVSGGFLISIIATLLVEEPALRLKRILTRPRLPPLQAAPPLPNSQLVF